MQAKPYFNTKTLVRKEWLEGAALRACTQSRDSTSHRKNLEAFSFLMRVSAMSFLRCEFAPIRSFVY